MVVCCSVLRWSKIPKPLMSLLSSMTLMALIFLKGVAFAYHPHSLTPAIRLTPSMTFTAPTNNHVFDTHRTLNACSVRTCSADTHSVRIHSVRTCVARTSRRHTGLCMTLNEGGRSASSSVPAGLQDAALLMKSSLADTLQQSSMKLFSVDLLTPGLNPKLENKAILSQEYLFDIVTSIIPVITAQHVAGKYRNAKFMFSSTGEAAGFQKYCYQMRIEVPEYLQLCDLDGRRISDDDDCIVFVAARSVIRASVS